MKYQQTREQSVGLFKQALRLMAGQKSGFHPPSYAIWYQHVSGVNEPLSEALRARLAAGPLNDEDVEELHDEYIRDRHAVRLARTLSDLILKVVHTARSAGADIARFRESLEERNVQLQEPMEQMAVRAVVAGLIGDTQKMHALTAELSEALAADLNQVETLQRRLKEAEQAAFVDSLTGLLNRRGFERQVEALLAQAGTLRGYALLFVDVDHFKRVNDSYGHVLGDKVLKAIAEVLKATVKGQDIAARFGGEEFAVLLPMTPVEGARAVAEKIRLAVAQRRIRQQDGATFGGVTVSVGVCEAQEHDSLTLLLDRADKAMYLAKQQGRNNVFAVTDPAGTV